MLVNFVCKTRQKRPINKGAADKATINASCSYRLQVFTILDLIVADTVKTFILHALQSNVRIPNTTIRPTIFVTSYDIICSTDNHF